MTDIAFVKASSAPLGLPNLGTALMWADGSGAGVVMDFLTKAIIDGHGYQCRDGFLTTPIVADVEVTTVAAELAVNSAAGLLLIPIRYVYGIESLNGGTLPQVTVKMTGTVASGGTAFTPTPLLVGGGAANSTALANDAGGVTVLDDTSTTRLLYVETQAAVGNWATDVDLYGRGAVKGAGNIYVAVGSVTAGVQYFHALSYLEFTTGQLGL